MMKVTLRISSLLFVLISWSATIWAQPANDDCGGAFVVPFSASEATVVTVNGDTRGATASSVPNAVCSTIFYTDDIYFAFTTPASVDDEGIVVRAYFDNSSNPTDVSAIGMALYASCAPGEIASHCFSSTVPEDDRFEVSGLCLLTNHTYYLRVWSTGDSLAGTEGTVRIGVYPNDSVETSLWWETFAGGLEANGWTTTGTCAVADSNENAAFVYLPEGLIDQGAYAAPGYRVSGASYCDGAVGVDSDFNDNGGVQGAFGTGQCPTPGTKFLVSPAIYSGGWDVAGLTLTWTQAIRQYQSTYFISYRTRDVGNDWGNWSDIQVNQEFVLNSAFFDSDVQRFFMPGAAGHDSLQIRFVYNDNYYLWAIDDVKLVETECNNLRVQSNFYAIPPWVQIPADQVREFAALADIYNAGACNQTNVVLNFTVIDTATGIVVYNRNLAYGTIGPDSLAENRLFPQLVDLPKVAAGYLGRYTLTSDSTDFDPSDNSISFYFSVGGDVFAHEDGFTRSLAVNGAIYDVGAPLSYAYGNIFRPENDATVERIVWGVNNPLDMMGKTVSIYLIQWTDTNGDLIAEATERRFVGYNDYTFTGGEGDNAILETVLENFDNPGDPVVMRAGFQYIALVEYVASTADDPQFFLLANDTRNFSAQVLAMDSAYAHGLVEDRLFMTALGFSPDGNIANIDYEVRELDGTDSRIFFGEDIVPLIRIVIRTVNTNEELPLENLVSVFPNPATDEVRIKLEFSTPNDDVQLRLLNPLGQVVYEKVLNATISEHTELINVRDLTAGNYLLQVETSEGQRSIPVVVVK